MNKVLNPWRPFMFLIGIVTAAVGCYGAYEYGLKLEGGKISYLAIGAPIVAVVAAFAPPFAEHLAKQGEYTKAACWWLTLIPAAAMIFFAAAERVHMAKASHEAETRAQRAVAYRANDVYVEAKNELKLAEAEEAKAKVQKNCNTSCQVKLEVAQRARQKLAEAEDKLLKAESLAATDSEWKAPPWLLPVTLDIIAFMAIWSGLSGPWVQRIPRKFLREKFISSMTAQAVVDKKTTTQPPTSFKGSILSLKRK